MSRYRNNLYGAAAFRSFIPTPLQEVSIEPDDEMSALIASAEKAFKQLNEIPMTEAGLKESVFQEAKSSWQLSSGKSGNPFSLVFGDKILDDGDKQEIDDIVAATEYGVEMLPKLPLSTRLFKQLHYIITRFSRYEKKYPGEYCNSPVWIGRVGSNLQTAHYMAPVVEDMVPAITDLENYINYDESAHPLVQAALIHYQFEVIHPFIDANGRVGRLLNTLFLIEKGMLKYPVLQLSEALKRVAAQYYFLLNRVSSDGNYREWINFFFWKVEGAAVTSKRILSDEYIY